MLNYSKENKKDLEIKNKSLRCGLNLFLIFISVFLIYNYSEKVLFCLELFIAGFVNVLNLMMSGFVSLAIFLKPMFNYIGHYLLLVIVFFWLWSLYVFSKIEPNCLNTNEQWKKICHIMSFFILIYTFLYINSLEDISGNEKYAGIGYAIIWFSAMSHIYISTLSRSRTHEE